MNLYQPRLVGMAALGIAAACAIAAAARQPAFATASARLHFDFNDARSPWAVNGAAASSGVVANASVEAVGTVDTYGGSPTPALRLIADFSHAKGSARASLASGIGRISNTETSLDKLTLSFDLWVNRIRPVRVIVESLDAAGKPTGARYAVVLPPIRDAYYRFGIDLDKTKPLKGRFDPKAPGLQCYFEFNDADAPVPRAAALQLRVDNLSYTAPAYYVHETGSDAADGRTEKTAFATIQKAVDAAKPGDMILIMDGTYRNATAAGVTKIAKSGTPAEWIVIRAYPGQKPQLVNTGWEVFKLVPGAAYIELRGLAIRGNRPNVKLTDALADGVIKTRDGVSYPGDPLFNGNGISADGRGGEPAIRPHHLRYIGNYVYDNCGGGLSAIATDYVTIEGNLVYDNVHYMRYGGSGISFLLSCNFSAETNHHNFVIGNHVYNNRCYVPWAAVGKMSDGNGIIVDTNIDKDAPTRSYTGRTLIANNVVSGSGGGGITVTTSQGVDIVHNTVYHNVQTPELAKSNWGDIFVSGPLPGSRDVTVLNNIVVADPGHARINASRATDTLVRSNLFYGGDAGHDVNGKAAFEDNRDADPRFVRPSDDSHAADFHLLPDSPAIGKARPDPRIVPPYDFWLAPRSHDAAIGACEFKRKP